MSKLRFTLFIALVMALTVGHSGGIAPVTAQDSPDPLLVASTIPEAGASGIDTTSDIVVAFDRPVVPLGTTEQMAALPSPITFDPPIEGSGEWINTSLYVFTPSERLQGSTTYTVTVPAGLTAVDGATTPQAYEWTFTTPDPMVTNIEPIDEGTAIPLENPIVVTFNQSVDRESAEAAFTLRDSLTGEPVVGSFAWLDDNSILVFTPATLLALETPYIVSLASGISSANGEAQTANEITSMFTTVPYPAVAETFPANGDEVDTYYRGYGIYLRFNAPIQRESLRGRIHIDPEPADWQPRIEDYDPQGLYIDFTLQPDTTYTITIDAGVEDIYGNPTRADYTYSFTTLPPQPDAYPVIAGSFNVTGAYRPDTTLGMRVTGEMDINFALYQLPFDDISGITFADFFSDEAYSSSDNYLFSGDVPEWATEANRIRTWTQHFEPSDGDFFAVNLASEEGGQLDPGLYWVAVYLPVRSRLMSGSQVIQFALAVSDTTVTAVRSADETLVWATDMQTGAPVPDMNVEIYHEGEVVASGTTDENGLYAAPVDLLPEGLEDTWQQDQANIEDARIIISAVGDNHYGAWYSNIENSLPTERGYLYTDRPVYRPGETVYFRGVLRQREDMDYTVPDIGAVHVTIKQNYGERVYFDGMIDVSSFGTYSGEFVIPQDAPLSEVVILADFGDGEAFQYGYIYARWDELKSSSVIFNVAEFRVPEYVVEVTPDQDSIIQGDELSVLVDTQLYAGGAVQNAYVTYRAYGDMAGFNYTGEGNYVFLDVYARQQNQGYFYAHPLLSNSGAYEGSRGSTDIDGHLVFSLGSTVPPTDVSTPMKITIAVDVRDGSGLTISDQTSVIAHPANVYVGLGTDNYFLTPEQANSISIITVTPGSTPRPNTDVQLEIYEIQWERTPSEFQFGEYTWTQRINQIGTENLTTDANGQVNFEFTPPAAGSYMIRALVTDEQGRDNSASFTVYAPGEGAVFGAQYSSSTNVTILADKTEYLPGDTASLLIGNPFGDIPLPVSALITVERANIMQTDVITFEGASTIYELPLTDEHAPNVFVNVVTVVGIWEDSFPDYATGFVELTVEPIAARLNVVAVPSAEQAAPRDSITFDITVTDANGDPVKAELGIALTDEAVLALMDRNSATLEAMFYGQQRDQVVARTALSALIDPLVDATLGGGRGGGGGGGGGGILIREDFDYTPLWAPHVVTDANGQATVTVTLPDNLTTWRLDARGVTMDTKVGETTTQLVSTLPLFVRPVAPRFMVVGDQVELAAVIQNNTDTVQEVEARLEAVGVTIEDGASQTITIPAGSSRRVAWMATVDDVEGVDMTFFAIGDGVQDAARPALRTGDDDLIPVYTYTAPDTTGTGGALFETGDVIEAIVLPQTEAPISGELRVELLPSLAASAIDSLDYLRTFPHQCIEQKVSRFLPNVVTYQALRTLGIENVELEANLTTVLTNSLVDVQAAQNADGGWGWFEGMESNTLVTAYALLGLSEAKIAGFDVNVDTLADAVRFLSENYPEIGLDTPDYILNRLPVFIYAQGRWQKTLEGVRLSDELTVKLDALFEYRDQMTVAARAFMLLAYNDINPDNANIPALIADITDDAILTATGAQWQENTFDWINWGSDTRTTALSLLALARTDPDNPLLPNAVRWLMTARHGDHWATTQETAWSVMAFSEWMQISGELEGDYTYTAAINDEFRYDETVTPETVMESAELRIAIADLLVGSRNTLTISRREGTGALYYSAWLETRLPAESVTALNRGVSVSREYFFGADKDARIDSAAVGDVITVRLTVVLPQDVFFFALEDPIPAGTESINTALNTSDSGTESALFADVESRRFWFFNGWAYDRVELRDQATFLYADFLPRGTYVYSYQLRATQAGVFHTLPAEGYAFYQPELFGRTDGGTFTVTNAE